MITRRCFPVTFNEETGLQAVLGAFVITQVMEYLERFFFSLICPTADGRRGREGEGGRRSVSVSDRPGQPIGSPSASAALPSAGGRGRAGRLPKRGVRVGVNG